MVMQYKVQMEYDSEPSILFKFKDKFAEFMKTTNRCTTLDVNQMREDLAEEYSVRIVETNGCDVDHVGYTPSRA